MYFLMVFLYIYLYFYVLVRAPNCTPLAVFHCAGIFAQIVQIAWPCILYLYFYVSVFYYVCYESMLCYTMNLWFNIVPQSSSYYDVMKMDETVA